MPFYQNVFDSDFIGHLLLEDRQYVLDFKVPANFNKSAYTFAWANPPYNTVGNTTLTMKYSIDAGKIYHPLTATISSGAAKTANDIATDLNGNTNFASLFTAQVVVTKTGEDRLLIKSNNVSLNHQIKFYVVNGGAESVLRFNAKAGIAQIPSFFARHTVENYIQHGPSGDNTYPDSQGMLVALTQPTDDWYITNAGLSTTAKEDWELLRGRSRAFMFQKITVDGSDRITQIIEYPAGALAGDLAKQIDYVYTGANTFPDQITEIMKVLETGDLVTP